MPETFSLGERPTMKTRFDIQLPSFVFAALCIVHSALCIAAEPPPAASQEGVQLWEGGPFWADRNVGAEEPTDSGLHFWWGDTLGYKRADNKWVASDDSAKGVSFIQIMGLTPSFGKDPATLLREGWITQDGFLAPEHDAARANWGGEWRMPTKRELEDLRGKCDWTWTTNGASGYVVRGRGDFAGASIFLPAAGVAYQIKWLSNGSTGYLWASDPHLQEAPPNYHSWLFTFNRIRSFDKFEIKHNWNRFLGATVRPVRGAAEKPDWPGFEKASAPPSSASAAVAAVDGPGGSKGVRLWEGGPYWSDRNIGSAEPWDEGYFFWWGDRIGYKFENDRWEATDGSVSGFSFCISNTPTFRMTLEDLKREGYVTNVTLKGDGWTATSWVLAPDRDPAQVHWGGGWRMPTCQELMDIAYNKCDWEWITTNGVPGSLVRGRGAYAGASIFLPATGMGNFEGRMDKNKFSDHYGSDPRPDDTHCTWRLETGRPRIGARVDYHWDRFCGVPVRPVLDE